MPSASPAQLRQIVARQISETGTLNKLLEAVLEVKAARTPRTSRKVGKTAFEVSSFLKFDPAFLGDVI